MNIQFSDDIIEIFDYIGEKIGITIDWTNANVLPKIEELCGKFINWEYHTSVAWIIIAWICFVILLIAAIYLVKVEGWCGDTWGIPIIVFVLTIIVTCTQVFDILECKYFPEKKIYDYISENFKSNN